MADDVVRVELPDGTPVWARVHGAEQLDASAPGGYADSGLSGQAAARLESLRELVTGVAGSLADGVRAVRPDEVSIAFGIEFAVKSGKVVGLLADGEAKSAVTVTLTWQHDGPPADLGTAPAAPGSPTPAPDPRGDVR